MVRNNYCIKICLLLNKITVVINILQPYLFSGGINGLCEGITTFCNMYG